MKMKALVLMLVCAVAGSASAAIVIGDTCGSVESYWTTDNATLSSDGDVLTVQGSGNGSATASFGATYPGDTTLVFDIKVNDAGSVFSGVYLSRPGEGLVVWDDLMAADSNSGANLMQFSADTWYKVAINYVKSNARIQYYIVEGLDGDLTTAPMLQDSWEQGWTEGPSSLTLYAYGSSNFSVENVTLNEGLDFTQVPEPATMSLFAAGGLLGLVRRRRK